MLTEKGEIKENKIEPIEMITAGVSNKAHANWIPRQKRIKKNAFFKGKTGKKVRFLCTFNLTFDWICGIIIYKKMRGVAAPPGPKHLRINFGVGILSLPQMPPPSQPKKEFR